MVSERNITDEQLLGQFIAGNEHAFDELVRRYYKQIYRFLVRFTGQPDLAEDLTQETFIKVHQSARTFDIERQFKPWIFSIAANKARDSLRSAARAGRKISIQSGQSDQEQDLMDIVPGEYEPPDKRLIEQETADRVRKALLGLPGNLREVLILAYYERLQYKEIAEILAIPLGTVKSRLHKAVMTFAQVWQASEHERRARR